MSNDYFSVVASINPDYVCDDGEGWVFKQGVKQLAPLPSSDSASAWARRNGGTPASGNSIHLDVQNRNHHRVIIDRIQVKVVSATPPQAKTIVRSGGGCGGGFQSAFFIANLDRDRQGTLLATKPVSGVDEAGRKVEVAPLPHRLDDQEPTEQWRIRLDTKHCACAFVPVVSWSSEGTTGQFEITNHGEPWRVTSYSGATRADRVDASGRWEGYGVEK